MSAARGLVALMVGGGLAPALAAARGAAQQPPAWTTAWSPLASAADVPRSLPGAPPAPELLVAPAPRVGLFWTAGNPGAIAFDVHTGYSVYRVAGTADDGAYRRALDPGRATTFGLGGQAWSTVGGRGAAAGRVVIEDEDLDPGAFSHELQPYTSSPLVESDTSAPAVRRVRAGLEGALGWRVGEWGLGAAGAYEAVDNRTQVSRLPHIGRAALPGASVGIVRRLGFAGLSIGARARYLKSVETMRIISRGAGGTVYELQGLSEPLTKDVNSNAPYYRRFERRGWAYGVAVAGAVLGTSWTAFAERERHRETQTSFEQNNPPVDRWTANGWTAGGAAQHALPRGLGLVTAQVRWTTLDGSAELANLQGIFYQAHETLLEVGGEYRIATRDSGWTAALGVLVRHDTRGQQDYLALLQANQDVWMPGAAVAVARELLPGTSVSVAYAYARHYAASRIPNPTTKGPAYQRYVAPALALDATQAASQVGTILVRHRVSAAAAVWLRARYERLAPQGPGAVLPAAPTGERTALAYTFGVVVGL